MTEAAGLGLEDRGAVISDDGLYRYLLWRRWDRAKPRALFIMLNPSTADANIDDPTIRRCCGFSRAWGFGGIRVVNLYPFRATKPEDLWAAENPLGQANLLFVEKAIDIDAISIAAWGAHGREREVKGVRNLFYELGIPLYALKLTKDGAPGHPLYIPANAVPIIYEPSRNPIKRGDPWAAPSNQEPGR